MSSFSNVFNLQVFIDRADNLARKDFFAGAAPSSYAKAFIDNKLQRHVTDVKNTTQSPIWAQSFKFIGLGPHMVLYIKIYDKVVFGKDRFLGMVTFPVADLIQPEAFGQYVPYARPLRGREGHNDAVSGQLLLKICVLRPGMSFLSPGAESSHSFTATPTTPSFATPLPAGWEARRDNQGRNYYVNHITRTTQWEFPTTSSPTTPYQTPLNSRSSASLPGPLIAQTRERSASGVFPSSASSSATLSAATSRISLTGVDTSNRNATTRSVSGPAQQRRSVADLFQPVRSQAEEPLPNGWEMRITAEGRVFFIDHMNRRSQWEDPRTGRIPPSSSAPTTPNQISAQYAALESRLGPLPGGWEQRFTADGRAFFVDHINRRTQWNDPRYNPEQLAQIEQQQISSGIVVPKPAPAYIRDYQGKLAQFRQQPELKMESGKTEITVGRQNLFEDSFRAIAALSSQDLKKRLWIKFAGEDGLDYGGLAREWFHLLSKEMFNPYYCLFEYSASDNYTLQISPNSDVNPDHLSYFKFIGRVAGMAVFHSKFLDGFFVSSFYKRMLGKEVTLEDMQSVDPDRHQSLTWMLENDITNVLFETFSVSEDRFGETIVTELKEQGKNIEVTNENKQEYVKLYVKWRAVRGTERQMNAFLLGFHEFIPPNLLRMFDPKEIEYLIGGLAEIDVDDWEANTIYKNYTASDKVVRFFWMIVRKFSSEERCRLLQFVTGTSRVPATGFKDLWGSDGPRKFCVEKWGTPESIPRAHTCFNRIDLPPCLTYESMEAKLKIALEEGYSFTVE